MTENSAYVCIVAIIWIALTSFWVADRYFENRIAQECIKAGHLWVDNSCKEKSK
jgi:hypothetical protein